MSNTFNAANMVKLSTDFNETMKITELENCKTNIRYAAMYGKREVFMNVTHSIRTFICTELEALGFKVELDSNVRISW